jgi:outer membrane biosynthesis protein TonB
MEISERHPDTGLHDIQKLAAQHKAQEEEREARERVLTPLEGTPVPSVVGMPVKAVSHRPRWVYIAGGAVFVCVAAAAGVFVLARHQAGGAVAAAAVLPQVSAPAAAPIAKAEPVAKAEPAVQQLPVAEPAEPEKKAAAPKAKATHAAAKPATEKAETPKAGKAASKAGAATPAPAAAPSNPRDELDQLLATSTADDARGKVASPAADDGSLPEAPSREGITAAMGKIKGRVQACYEKFQQTGVATVEVSIAKTGKVQSATTSGKFADTDTGNCVAAAVKAANFPRFKGPTLKIDYPFLLQAQ